MKVDVLVAGGGPAGLAAAERAARGGARVLVLHRDAEIGLPVRTSGGSWKRHLDELGVPERLYLPLAGLVFAAPGRRIEAEFGADRAVVLDVTATYRWLAELARAAGARIECGAVFERVLEEGPEGVRCAACIQGEPVEIEARYVVDGTGHQRAVSKTGASRAARYAVGVEAEYRNEGGDGNRAVLFVGDEFAPAGYGWIFPTLKGTVRVGIGVIRPDTKASPGDLLERFMGSRLPGEFGLRAGELVEKHFGVIPSDGTARRFVRGRVVLAGDSAGHALALVGEGIRYCIEAGRMAGEAVANAMAEPARAQEHLKGYQRWWEGKYRRIFTLAQKANERMGRFTDTDWNAATRLLEGAGGDELARLLRVEIGPWETLKLLRRGGVRFGRFLCRACQG